MVILKRLSLGFARRQKTDGVTQLLLEAGQRATPENRMEVGAIYQGATSTPRWIGHNSNL
jgi:hypothetical protein